MRQAPHQKRPRGNRGPGRRGNSQGGNRTIESNGPSAKIRGNAAQLFEKYQAMARDASTSGDRVASENYFQHAEHYYRLLNGSNAAPQRTQGSGNGQARPPAAAEAAPQPQAATPRPPTKTEQET